MSNEVVDRIRIGGLTLTVTKGQYGNSFIIEKSYKDKQSGEWENTPWMNEIELPAIKELIDEYFSQRAKYKQADPGQANTQQVTQQFTDQATF